ncbi:hypothetical protein COOONC_25272 [Cooperia oncophora]
METTAKTDKETPSGTTDEDYIETGNLLTDIVPTLSPNETGPASSDRDDRLNTGQKAEEIAYEPTKDPENFAIEIEVSGFLKLTMNDQPGNSP